MQSKIITVSFTENFLEKAADWLIEQGSAGSSARLVEHRIRKSGLPTGQPVDLSRFAVVFGGKRPALFLKRELARRIKGSFYPPQFFSIDDFIAYLAAKKEPFQSTQDLDTCYLLYRLAQEHTPQVLKGRETFAAFLPWTREILSFIDQLDLENVDEKRLKNIEANAAIGYPVPQDINRLLESIVTLRQAYHATLLKEKKYSRGLQYLRAGQSIEKTSLEEFDQIVFCNFFYFNKSEEKIVENLFKRNKATLIFQGDQRKWPVLSRIARVLDTEIKEGEEGPKATHFNLKLYSGFDGHTQAGLIREIIKKIKETSPAELNKTVIVLPNPDHIVPLVSEITPLVQEFNISMGYPLRRSSLYTLFSYIFDAQLSRKFSDGKRPHRYYAKDYLKVVSHPFIKNLKLSPGTGKIGDPAVTRILMHKIEEILTGKEESPLSGSLFFELEDMEALDELYMCTSEMLDRLGLSTSREDLQKILERVHELVFAQWESAENFRGLAKNLGILLDVLVDKSFMHHYPLNLNIAEKMYAIKDELSQAAFHEEKFPQEELFRIFDSKVSREIIAFMGSPLKGLQVLGLFETRSLNFEHVIIGEVNEGALPRLQIYEPLIPRDVMISLNLDRLEMEEEIQRYQFMRLISSAKNVHLVYQESKDKERSRFIEELIWEEEKKKGRLDVVRVTRASFEVKSSPSKRSVRKTPEMIAMLAKHRYSASSLNTYLKNPMEFYYKYVLGLEEEDDLLDEPEARHVGTFVHELLEHCFRTFLNRPPRIDASFRRYLMGEFEKRFENTFGRSMKSDSFLLKSVLEERLNRFLDNEEKEPERQVEKILFLENRFEDVIALPSGDVRFTLIVDRIDKLKDGTIMILDYKTGSIDQMPAPVEKLVGLRLSREIIRDQIKSFQLPLYFYYLDKQYRDQPINAALYNLRTLEVKKFVSGGLNMEAREELNSFYLRALDFVVREILDPAVPFVEDPEA